MLSIRSFCENEEFEKLTFPQNRKKSIVFYIFNGSLMVQILQLKMSENGQNYERYMQNRQKQTTYIESRNQYADRDVRRRNSKRFNPYNNDSLMKNDVKNSSSSNVDVQTLMQNLMGKGMIPHSSTSPGQNLKVQKSQECPPQPMDEPTTMESGLLKPIVLSSFHPSLKL